MIEPELLEAVGKIAGVIAVAVFTGWSKIESSRAKHKAEEAHQQAVQTDKDVNVIDLSKGDRARNIEKFINIESRLKALEDEEAGRRLRQLEDAYTMVLKTGGQ